MKTAKLFLTGMYLHLILSAATPIIILWIGEWNLISYGLFFFYLCMIGAMLLTGWICMGCSVAAYRKGYGDKLKKASNLRKQPDSLQKPSGIHYLLQLLSVFDVISTIYIFRKYAADKKPKE